MELKATTAQEIVREEKDCDYMDELFGGVKMPPTQVYLKSEADNVIAELKRENERLKKQSSCTFSEDCLRVRQIRAENESLKAKLAEKDEEIDKQKWRGDEWAKACNQKDKEIESLKASHYAEMVDEGMRERKLKRALWLARSERAKDRKYKYETWERNELKKFNWDGDLIAIVSMKARKWRRVEIKCIKKAEEYTDEQT